MFVTCWLLADDSWNVLRRERKSCQRVFLPWLSLVVTFTFMYELYGSDMVGRYEKKNVVVIGCNPGYVTLFVVVLRHQPRPADSS